MKEIIVPASADGKRLDRFLASALPALKMGLRQKFLRLKRIKVNGKAAAGETRLAAGDRLSLYIGDEFFAVPKKIDPFLSKIAPRLNILFENEQIMIVDKRAGMVAHPDACEKVHTLITYAQAYLYKNGEFDSMNPNAFRPALANRIDRFTGGVVLIAKTEAALSVLTEKSAIARLKSAISARFTEKSIPRRECSIITFSKTRAALPCWTRRQRTRSAHRRAIARSLQPTD